MLDNNENIDLMKIAVQKHKKEFIKYGDLMSPIFETDVETIELKKYKNEIKNCSYIYQVLAIKDLNTETNDLSCFIGFSIQIFGNKIYLHIENSMTFPNYRRKGFSSILRLVLINYCYDNKFYKMTSDTNESSKRLLKKLGFEETKGPKTGRKWVRNPQTKKLEKEKIKDADGNYVNIKKRISENNITFNMFIEFKYYIYLKTLFDKFKKNKRIQI